LGQSHTAAPPFPLQIDKCFGFETSVERSQGALMAAKVEARSTRRGIGLVKLMGRSSGFITMQASMASGEAGGCRTLKLSYNWRLNDWVKYVVTWGRYLSLMAPVLRS
jgi:6-phosphofructokinase